MSANRRFPSSITSTIPLTKKRPQELRALRKEEKEAKDAQEKAMLNSMTPVARAAFEADKKAKAEAGREKELNTLRAKHDARSAAQ